MCMAIPTEPGWRVQDGSRQGTVIAYHNRTFEVTVRWHDRKGSSERFDVAFALLWKVEPTPEEVATHPERWLSPRDLQMYKLLAQVEAPLEAPKDF